MPTKTNIIWLASYPKSGNTWLRIFLSNYLNTENKPININNINSSFISSSRFFLDKYLPFLSSDLTFDQIDILRPKVYSEISRESNELLFVKTHDAFTKNKNNKPIFPLEVTKAIIQIVRNPLDVATSFAYHSNISIDKSIQFLNHDFKSFSNNPYILNNQLRQTLLSWSGHFQSWQKANAPRLLIKYENLIENPDREFRKIIQFIYNKVDDDKLKQAILFSSFSELKKQESKSDFKEKPIHAKAFFRKGIIGSWEDEITRQQKNQIITKHRKVMKELGYL